MSLQHLDLTTALRPSLQPDETLLFVQDGVGLYEGKLKITSLQNGQAYLTSHRVCYVDIEEPRKHCVAINLKDVDRYEFYAGFLKSSPKITLFLKSVGRPSGYAPLSGTDGFTRRPDASPSSGTASPFNRPTPPPVATPTQNATWICPICSFSNPVPPNYDPASVTAATPLPSCLACGIKPPWTHVLRAAISSASNRPSSESSPAPVERRNSAIPDGRADGDSRGNDNIIAPSVAPRTSIPCPRCTFLNHPTLSTCEMCGAALRSLNMSKTTLEMGSPDRTESPGPSVNAASLIEGDGLDNIKFSFRAGGEKLFYERLKGAMVQRKWLLQGAPNMPKPNQSSQPGDFGATTRLMQGADGGTASAGSSEGPRTVGIAGLEQRDLELRKKNEVVIGGAFEDLEALMTSAKEIVALAETFANKMPLTASAGSSEATALLSQSAAAMGLVTTKDMLTSGSTSESLYLSQLSRNLAEFLTDDATGVLRREGGIMSLVDLWAVFNRARGGVELVSPTDLRKAVDLWEKLKLPLRLRRFKSGLLVVQAKDWTDDKTISSLLDWLKDLHHFPPAEEVAWDWRLFGRGVSPRETAERFGWSVGVASEELAMAEENGFLCREEAVEGIRFWENWLVEGQDDTITAWSGHEALDVGD